MATITLSYDGRNTVAKSIVKMLETIGVFNILKDDAPNNHNIVKSPYNQEFVNKIKNDTSFPLQTKNDAGLPASRCVSVLILKSRTRKGTRHGSLRSRYRR